MEQNRCTDTQGWKCQLYIMLLDSKIILHDTDFVPKNIGLTLEHVENQKLF